MWDSIVGNYSNALPQFNNDLLLKFRKDKIDSIPKYLDELFRQACIVLDKSMPPEKDRLNYISYSELTPEERVAYIRSKNNFTKKFEIQQSTFKIIKFEFEFKEELFHMHVDVPYMVNNAILVSGIDYHPLFAIVEKGGMHRIRADDEVILQVMRAKLRFWRSERGIFRTTDDRLFREVNITCKVHQKSSAKRKYPPLIIYGLASCNSLPEALNFYFGNPNVIQVVDNCLPCKGQAFIEVNENVYLKVSDRSLGKQDIRRFIVSMLVIFKFHPKFNINDIQGVNYYRVALGKWTYPTVTDQSLLYKNAVDHLHMNESMLDEVAKVQHRSIGIHTNTINELLREAWFNIDKWLATYKPNDLYNKKLGSLEQMMSGLVWSFNTKLFKNCVNSKTGLIRENVNKIMNSSMYRSWINNSPMFRSKPNRYNDNHLLTISGKRFISSENDEIGSYKTGKSEIPIEALIAHPSWLVVVSILCYPSSNPIETGSINPFLKIDEDGNIIKPEWYKEIEDIFSN